MAHTVHHHAGAGTVCPPWHQLSKAEPWKRWLKDERRRRLRRDDLRAALEGLEG